MATARKNQQQEQQQALYEKLEETIESIRLLVNFLRFKSDNGLRHPRRFGGLDDFEMDYTPSPFSRAPITTQNQALEQIMLRSGMMSRETWETLTGVQYDAIGDNLDDDDFLLSTETSDSEFKQSPLASYYERKTEKIEIPNVETKKIDVASAPEQEIKEQEIKQVEVKND